MHKNIPTYKDERVCYICQGRCCKHMGCHFSPLDFPEISFNYLKEEIEKGMISIDWWEDDEPQYYLRMRHVGAPVVDPSWGGRCIALTDQGCSLSFEYRPLGGKVLKPSLDMKCKSSYTKEMCKDDWSEYEEILKKLVEYFS